MSRPFVAAGVEQGGQFAGLRIEASNVGPFERVAVEATQAKVAHYGQAAMFLGDDVICFEGRVIRPGGNPAIFAMTIGLESDLPSE